MSDSENDSKRMLECLRLASDLNQLANDTLNPDLKAHCLRMAKQWSGEADAPAKTTEARATVIEYIGADRVLH
jgi:hypothetical protein